MLISNVGFSKYVCTIVHIHNYIYTPNRISHSHATLVCIYLHIHTRIEFSGKNYRESPIIINKFLNCL